MSENVEDGQAEHEQHPGVGAPGSEVRHLELGQPPRNQQPEQREAAEHDRRQRYQGDRGEDLDRSVSPGTSQGSVL